MLETCTFCTFPLKLAAPLPLPFLLPYRTLTFWTATPATINPCPVPPHQSNTAISSLATLPFCRLPHSPPALGTDTPPHHPCQCQRLPIPTLLRPYILPASSEAHMQCLPLAHPSFPPHPA